MKKKLTTTALLIGSVTSAPFCLAQQGPEFYGLIDGGVQKIANQTDIDGTAFQVVVGVRGVYQEDGLTLVYKLESELQDVINDDDGKGEIKITNALMVLPTQYGTFIVAPRAVSGEILNIYRVVDFFENSQIDTSSGMWGQPREASSAFVYETPKMGDVTAAVTVLTLAQVDPTLATNATNYNDKTADVVAAQMAYRGDTLSLALGVVGVSADQLPDWIEDTYYRNSISVGYETDGLRLGLLHEMNKGHPLGDFSTTAVALDYQFGDYWSASMGITSKVGGDAPDGAPAAATTGQIDETLTLLTVRKKLASKAYAYAEVEHYDVAENEYSLGLKVDF
jgi:hypothetical protein